MKIAYFSPLNPQKSGISDFSEELLPYLKENMDVDIFTNDTDISNCLLKRNFQIYHVKDYDNEIIRKKYDLAVFQVGNNYECHQKIIEAYQQYGGILELHDISLHHYLAEETLNKGDRQGYINIMQYCHGHKGKQVAENFLEGKILAPWENQSMIFTVCKHLADKAQAIIVHSDYAKQMLKGMGIRLPIKIIPLHTIDIETNYKIVKKKSKQNLGLTENIFVLGSFGLATKEKRILEILDALKICKTKNIEFHYFIVGKVVGIDIKNKIESLSLYDDVTVVGFVELDIFKQYMQACDICLNLRYPTQGESSASLHRMLGMGKPIIVTDIGTFQEYPNDFAFKVQYDNNEINSIAKIIYTLYQNTELLDSASLAALEYAKNYCSIERNADIYFQFFQDILNSSFQEDYLDHLLDSLYL